MMTERYLPSSEFLNYVLADEIAFDNTPFGQINLERLLAMVVDEDRANRDWAAFLIAGLPLDSSKIRSALMTAADDTDFDTRDEAIVGLARRDRAYALQKLRPLLEEEIGVVLLEAATILGDRSLLPALRAIERWDGNGKAVRQQLRSALAACEAGIGQDLKNADLINQHRLT